MNFKTFYDKYGQHIVAVSILLLLGSIWWMYHENTELQKQISEDCGWGEEDYYCFCEKSKAMEIKNKMEELGGKEINLSEMYWSEGE